jgi:hypothetical protein
LAIGTIAAICKAGKSALLPLAIRPREEIENMKTAIEKLQFRQEGKGFIVSHGDNLIGRRLTKTFVDQHDRTYVQINGEFTPPHRPL